MKKIKVLSLFDGISCARIALKRAKIPVETYYASEVDKYAIQISQRNWPEIKQIGDVKNVKTYARTDGCLVTNHSDEEYHKIDLLIGGSPCQDLSIAKANRKGLDGERSGLFWEYVRILKEVKPKYFVLENVNSMPKEARELISETLGVEPVMINASLVSAQNRKRLFWIGKRNHMGRYEKVEVPLPEDRGILLRDILENGVGVEVINQGKEYTKELNKSLTLMARDYKGFGNQAMTGSIRIGQIGKGGQGDRIYSTQGKSVNLSANGGGRGAKTGLYAVALRNRGQGKKPEVGGNKANSMTTVQTDSMVAIVQKGRGYNKGGIHKEKSPTLTSNSFEENNKVVQNMQIRKLTPVECERLQGVPDGYTDGVSNTQRYKALGNAFNVDVVAHILKHLEF